MIKKLKENKEIMQFVFAFFVISFLTVFTKNTELMNYYSFLAFLPFAFLSIIYIFSHRQILIKNKILALWLTFLGLLLLSELQNGMIMDSIILLSITGIMLMTKLSMEKLLLTSIIGVFPVFIAALLGALLNNKFSSNSIGIVVSFFLVSIQLYFVLVYNKVKNKKVASFIFFLTNAVVLWVLYKINSRTSLLIVSSSTILIIFHIIYSQRKKIFHFIEKFPRITRIFLKIFVLLILLAFILFTVKAISSILTPKWRPNDISTGRFDIWRTTIKNRTLFGHKYDWYSTSGLFGEHKGPHNMVIGILAFGGVVPLIALLTLILLTLVKLFKQYFTQLSNLNFVLLAMLILSNIKGLTESLLLQSSFQLYNLFFILPLIFIVKDGHQIKLVQGIRIEKLLRLSIALFFCVMIINIYGSVFSFSLDNVISLVSNYI